MRDLDATGESTSSKDSDVVQPTQHHHHHSTRDRLSTAVLTHATTERTSVRNSSTMQSALMHLIKTGDLDTLKQLVREGVNVNEQDEHGNNALSFTLLPVVFLNQNFLRAFIQCATS